MELQLMGYWKSSSAPHYPHPIQWVDKNWHSAEQQKVVHYLKKAPFMPYAAGGHSYCRFACGKKQNGNREQSDGVYIWPEGLVHYVEQHQVKPPQEFIEHCLKASFPLKNPLEEDYTISETWWLAQVPHQPLPPAFQDPFQAQYPTYFLITLSPLANKKTARPFLQQLAVFLGTTTLNLYKELSSIGVKITQQQLEKLTTWKDFQSYITVKKMKT